MKTTEALLVPGATAKKQVYRERILSEVMNQAVNMTAAAVLFDREKGEANGKRFLLHKETLELMIIKILDQVN